MRQIALLFTAISTLAMPVFSQCGTQVISGYTTPGAMGWDGVNVVGQNFPSALAGTVSRARDIWNHASCNSDSGHAFTWFGAINGEFTVTVTWNPGKRADGACADFNPTTRQVTVYAQTTQNGNTVNCLGHNPDAIAMAIAHELGHFLGLDNTPTYCWGGMMMSPFQYDYNTGQFTPKSPADTECQTADQINLTDWEENPPPPDPFCNAYCWTDCIGDVCPDGHPDTGCPILIDMENDGIRLTGLNDPVWFDIDADGTLDLMAWTNRSEGLLALDRNDNGTIDDGGELFGNYTRFADGTRAPNGYAALAELDSWQFGGNGDGLIDAADTAFDSLRMWTDLNHDGVSQAAELRTLEEAGILRIGLDYRRSHRTDRHGNEFRFLGRAWKTGPHGVARPVLTWDVFFLVEP